MTTPLPPGWYPDPDVYSRTRAWCLAFRGVVTRTPATAAVIVGQPDFLTTDCTALAGLPAMFIAAIRQSYPNWIACLTTTSTSSVGAHRAAPTRRDRDVGAPSPRSEGSATTISTALSTCRWPTRSPPPQVLAIIDDLRLGVHAPACPLLLVHPVHDHHRPAAAGSRHEDGVVDSEIAARTMRAAWHGPRGDESHAGLAADVPNLGHTNQRPKRPPRDGEPDVASTLVVIAHVAAEQALTSVGVARGYVSTNGGGVLCCVVLLCVIGFARVAWFALPGTRRPEQVEFASPARRPVPGSLQVLPVEPAVEVRAGPQPLARLWMVVKWFGLGCVLYVVVAHALVAMGALRTNPDSIFAAGTRDIVFVGVGLLAMAIGYRARPAAVGGIVKVKGAALLGIGLAWWETSFVDMHVFGGVHPADSALVWDVIFHGAGLVVAAVGLVLLVDATGRSSRSASPAADQEERW